MKIRYACFLTAVSCGLLSAAVIDTNNPAIVAAFQTGATVVDFESIAGRTPQAITAYTSGDPVSPNAFIFNQIPGVQFSVGGGVGTNEPALYQLSGAIAGDAKSGTMVLGPVDFDFTTKFNNGALIEIFFPTKVSKVGFWLNPSLGNVEIIAADTNFAFSGLPGTNLEIANPVTAGTFVGIQRPTADIGGFKDCHGLRRAYHRRLHLRRRHVHGRSRTRHHAPAGLRPAGRVELQAINAA